MRNTVFIGMACVFLSACGVDVAERVHVVDSPVDTSDGTRLRHVRRPPRRRHDGPYGHTAQAN